MVYLAEQDDPRSRLPRNSRGVDWYAGRLLSSRAKPNVALKALIEQSVEGVTADNPRPSWKSCNGSVMSGREAGRRSGSIGKRLEQSCSSTITNYRCRRIDRFLEAHVKETCYNILKKKKPLMSSDFMMQESNRELCVEKSINAEVKNLRWSLKVLIEQMRLAIQNIEWSS